MRKAILLFAAAALVSGIAASCTKSNKSNTAADLLPGTWKGVSVAIDSNNNNVIDSSEIKADTTHEVYVFNKNASGTRTFTLGATTYIDTFSWTITENFTYVNITGSGYTTPLRIDYISHNNLTLRNAATTPVTWTMFIAE